MIENIDQNVGKLLDKLAELGVEEKTIVIFLCDNGPSTRRYVGPLRGMKGEVLEGGIRSPLFVRWPARLMPGVKSSEPAAHVDIMPTLFAAAGVEVPPRLALDGLNVLPLLEDGPDDWPERPIVLQWHRGDTPQMYRHFAIRRGNWKLLTRPGVEEPASEPGQEVVQLERLDLELYNVAEDPREENNLLSREVGIARDLLAAYEAWFRDVSTTREDNFAPPRMIVGSRQQPTVVLTRQDWRRLAGDGWGNQGMWLLDVEQAGEYDMTVRLAKPLIGGGGSVLVHARPDARSAEIPRGAVEVTLKLELGRGPLDLVVEVKTSEATSGPHQVVIKGDAADAAGLTRFLTKIIAKRGHQAIPTLWPKRIIENHRFRHRPLCALARKRQCHSFLTPYLHPHSASGLRRGSRRTPCRLRRRGRSASARWTVEHMVDQTTFGSTLGTPDAFKVPRTTCRLGSSIVRRHRG
jgi:arylsulfatase/arylsulfatase A